MTTILTYVSNKAKNIHINDGTGRNAYYLDENGKRTRNKPENLVEELFHNGSRRYYYRGSCIRCRQLSPSVFLVANSGRIGYCLNYCVECLKLTSDISEKSLRGKGDAIWGANLDVPMHSLIDLEKCLLDQEREVNIMNRAKKANLEVKKLAKLRRNADRLREVRNLALNQGIFPEGIHCSWGFGETYDEYFGPLDQQGQLTGLGMMVFSDGSIYIGEWKAGKKNTTGKGLWTRKDGTQYEGSWVNDLKHGMGTMRYPDQSYYVGEFAKGYEHGQGKKVYANGARFEGRFRFGKRDGPGVFTSSDGVVEKRLFKENDAYHEPAIPPIIEEEIESDTNKFFQPESLLLIALRALAKTMQTKRNLAPPSILHRRAQEFLKPLLSRRFLETLQPLGSKALIEALPPIAFQSCSIVSLNYIKFKNLDMESFLYCQASNISLLKLELINNRFDSSSLELFCKRLMTKMWPNLEHLDLSYNKIDAAVAQTLMNAIAHGTPKLKVLKMAGCQLTANCCIPISRFLMTNGTLEELDLAFNTVQAAGAEHLANAILINSTLSALSVRQNNIGMLGGEAFMNALKKNRCIKILCVADNKISGEVAVGISGRLHGNTLDVSKSFCANELNIRSIHLEKATKSYH